MPTPEQSYREIPLSRGLSVMVDDADYEWLSQWKWYADRCSASASASASFYARRNGLAGQGEDRTKAFTMHRIIMGLKHGDKRDVDHVNRNTLDNRRRNLRIASRSENRANTVARSDNKLGIKGVHWHKAVGKYQAQIQFKGVRHQLGWYDDPQLASVAYAEAAKRIHGEFARSQ